MKVLELFNRASFQASWRAASPSLRLKTGPKALVDMVFEPKNFKT